MVRVERYPDRTDKVTGSVGHIRIAIGEDETIRVLTQSTCEQAGLGVRTFSTRFLENAFFASSSPALIAPWQDALKRSIRRFQDGADEPRGSVPTVPLSCVAYDFIPARSAYIGIFNFHCAPGAAPLGCRYELHWNGGGWGFDANADADLNDRTKRRLVAALLEQLQGDAHTENEERERSESQRIREYRHAVARDEGADVMERMEDSVRGTGEDEEAGALCKAE
jgi:hypothetical protein